MMVKMKALSNRMKRQMQLLINQENARISVSGRKLQYKIMDQGNNHTYIYVRCQARVGEATRAVCRSIALTARAVS